MFEVLLVLSTLVVLLALPFCSGATGRSLTRFGLGLLISSFGIVIPLCAFFFSAGLTPDWKGDAPNGWVDCFHQGKLALTPFVLWATFDLYSLEINAREGLQTRDLAVGLFIGCFVAFVCFGYGLLGFRRDTRVAPFLIVPLYISIWQGIRAYQAFKIGSISRRSCVVALLTTVPFWVLGGFWSRKIYEALPVTRPGHCFVVSAAAKGHPRIVRSFVTIHESGQLRLVNQQLLTFWRLESLWQRCAPRSHESFRKTYNRIGPIIAKCITTPWAADIVYLSLKPLEWFARLIFQTSKQFKDLSYELQQMDQSPRTQSTAPA